MIQDAFVPLVMERAVLAIRQLFNTETIILTKLGTYDNFNVIMGHQSNNTDASFIIYLNNVPNIYNGTLEKKLLPRFHYKIDKTEYPPFDFDGSLVRYETSLPDVFTVKDKLYEYTGLHPTTQYDKRHFDKWHRVEISTKVLQEHQYQLKNLWAWTYEIKTSTVSGINVIYCRSKKDVQRLDTIVNGEDYGS